LLQYMAIMGPTQIAAAKSAVFTREAMMALWGPADAASKAMSFDQAVAAIQKQSDEYAQLLADWTDADFRTQIDMFGHKMTKGSFLVNTVLGGHAAYRMQLFCYLKRLAARSSTPSTCGWAPTARCKRRKSLGYRAPRPINPSF
jgi:hypothetical protein